MECHTAAVQSFFTKHFSPYLFIFSVVLSYRMVYVQHLDKLSHLLPLFYFFVYEVFELVDSKYPIDLKCLFR